MNYIMFRKGIPDYLAIFDDRKCVVKTGCIAQATAEAIVDRPTESAYKDIYFVPVDGLAAPAGCLKSDCLSLQSYLSLKPKRSIKSAPTPITEKQRSKVMELLNCGEQISVRRIARAAGVSPTTVQRLKKAA